MAKIPGNLLSHFFSNKAKSSKKITLIKGEKIITDDTEIAELMNDYFSKAVEKLHIKGYETQLKADQSLDIIDRVTIKYNEHPSILKIKENV